MTSSPRETNMPYLSPHTKAEKLRHALNTVRIAKKEMPLDLGGAEECVEGIEDDFDAIIRKGEAALDRLDALICELEAWSEEEETKDRYTLESHLENRVKEILSSPEKLVNANPFMRHMMKGGK